MVIYLAGKYSGEIDKNIQAARDVAETLWAEGYAVICPHTNTAHFTKATYKQYLDGDIEILSVCDAVIMLPGWEDSPGACQEHAFAYHFDIPTYYWPERPVKPS